MLNEFISLFIGAYREVVSPDFPLKDWFESIIVLVVEVSSITGALLFGAVAINAMFGVFRSR